MSEHSFQVPMPNSPLLLNHLCFGARFLQESRFLAFWQGCVLLPCNGAGSKQGLKNGFCLFNENPVVRFFSSLAHYKLALNPICQHYSDKILT